MTKKEKPLNILDYVQHNFLSFKEDPLNEVDLAIFAEASYFHFECFLKSEKDRILFEDLYDISKREEFLHNLPYGENDTPLFNDTVGNPRFKPVICTYYRDKFSLNKVEQFGAVSFILPSGELVVSFRGTDESINGWREDFDMAVSSPVPSQKEAYKYFLHHGENTRRKIYLCGHSKGGNLAVYTYLASPDKVQKQIQGVYSFDGPGLNDELKDRLDYESKKNKFTKFMPEESIVGQIFSSPRGKEIVKSEGKLINQHMMLNWHLTPEYRFERISSLDKNIHHALSGLNKWLAKSSQEEKDVIIQTLFDLLKEAGITDANQIMSNKFGAIMNLLDKYSKLDKVRKKKFSSIFMGLFGDIHTAMK